MPDGVPRQAGGLCLGTGERRLAWKRRSLPTADRAAIPVRRPAARCCSIPSGELIEEVGAYLGHRDQ